MTEKLEEQVKVKGITIFDGYQVIGILTDSQKNKAIGLITLNLNESEVEEKRYVLFNCTNIIYATGGPAGIYATSSYPKSQIGATGLAFEAGVWGKNVTESQYGIASIQFPWNLSGTYQQVLPRYISTEQDGSDERELLEDYFKDPGTMLDAIFLKGYQWPFDPKKIHGFGSSLIDILVYNETVINGRRVWLDFMHNPNWGSKSGELDFALLGKESYQYLKNSNALFGTPIKRLARMNQPAIDLYKEHNIDITKEYLEIAVCAQHNNGGLYGNYWWESNLEHFFPVGEVNGSHGVYRPGGSALNSGQVGSTRAAQYITARYQDSPQKTHVFLQTTERQIKEKIDLGQQFLGNARNKTNVMNIRREIGERMTRRGAHIRSLESVCEGAEEAKKQLSELTKQTQLSSSEELGHAFQNYDLLITQFVYLSAIKDYIEKGGRSRGSYLIKDPLGTLPVNNISDEFRFTLDEGSLNQKIQKVYYRDGICEFKWDNVKPIPRENNWFENVWNDYMQDNIIR